MIPVRPIDENIVNIIALENGFRADVFCVFCPTADCEMDTKKYAVQYDKYGNWNLSNLNKHLKRHTKDTKDNVPSLEDNAKKLHLHGAPSQQRELSDDNSLSSALNEADILKMPIVHGDEDEQCESNDTSIKHAGTMHSLYQQFAAQNLELTKATMANSETKKFIVVNIDERFVNICINNILKNGNCLYASLAHQLYYVKIGSKEHIEMTAKLRKDVVNQILANFDDYKRAIELSFSDDDAGKEYISTDLSKNGEWGGSGTFLAVKNMFEVNVLVFKERGPAYFALGFNPSYKRTVFLAYRFVSIDNPTYNHYESVCGISEELLYKFAQHFGSNIDKEFNLE